MMGNGASWGAVAHGLGDAAQLHAMDLPSHGKSPAWQPDQGHFANVTLTGVHPHLAALASEAPDGRVDLIGHSFGAVMALALAVANPDAVRSVSLVEPVMFAALPPETRDPDGLMTQLAEDEARGDRAASTARFLRYWDGPDLGTLPVPAQQQMVGQMAAVLDTMADLYDDRQGVLGGRLASLTAPVLVITGGRSPAVIGEIAGQLAQRLPDAQHFVVAGASHMVPLTHPAEVAALIADNIRRA